MKTKLRIIDKNAESDIFTNHELYCDGSEVLFAGYSSLYEPVTVSELTRKLEDNNNTINIIQIIEDLSNNSYSIEDIEYVKSMYSKIINNSPEEEDSNKIYNIEVDPRKTRSTSNLLGDKVVLDFVEFENSITFDLLSDSEYTSIVNLSDIKGTYGMAEVCIKYSIEDNIRSYNTIIDIFGGNIIEEVDDIITLEYIGKVLKVIPKSNTISECIINNCRITYGIRI